MRKKYLSALLFGALLFASAGTFTSCKDYDDDINNLQEQINTVVSDLNSLKTTVDNLGGYVTDVKVENGKLVVTIDNNTVSYDLPAGADVADVKIENGHLYVNDVDKGEVGSKVTVNEDGELLIDGNASGLKVGTEVIIKDATNGVYTISIGEETIQLPMITAFVSVETIGSKIFTDLTSTNETGGIYWGEAGDKVDWKGPKGTIAKKQLLVGQISNVQLSVLPASYDLGAQELKLIDSKGNIAPVTVKAIAANEQLTSGSRTASSNLWNLSIEMTDDVTTNNIGEAFANSDNNKNVKYALSVNGTLVSGYDYIVDTRENAYNPSNVNAVTSANCALNGKHLSAGATTADIELGTNTFTYTDSRIYDYYIEIAEKDINDADAWGISVENNQIIAKETAAGKKISLNVNIVDVTGKVLNKTITVTVAGSTVAPGEITAVDYKVDPTTINTPTFKVDLGTTFTGLTSSEAISITKIEWVNDAKANAKFLATGVPTQITYKDKDGKTVSGLDNATNLKKITSAELKWDELNDAVEPGTYTLELKLMNGTSEVKKVNVPVNVTLPTFSELFKNSDEWADGQFNTRVVLGSSVPQVNFTRAFVATSTSVAFDTNFDLTVDEVKVDGTNVIGTNSNGVLNLTTGAINDKYQFAAKTLQVTASYKIAGKEGLKVSSSKFTTNVASIAEGIQLVYLDADGKEATSATVINNNQIAIAVNDKGVYKKGLALKFGDKYAPLYTASSASNIGFILSTTAPTTWTGDATTLGLQATTPNLTGVSPTIPTLDTGVVTLANLAVGTASTLQVTVTDVMNVKTILSISFK
jgi:hypothetical protein